MILVASSSDFCPTVGIVWSLVQVEVCDVSQVV